MLLVFSLLIGGSMAQYNLINALQDSQKHAAFKYMLEETGSLPKLSSWNGITVYAPTDEAFEKAGIDVTQLTKKQMMSLVAAHVVNTRVIGSAPEYGDPAYNINLFGWTPLRLTGQPFIQIVYTYKSSPHEFTGDEKVWKLYGSGYRSVLYSVSKVSKRPNWDNTFGIVPFAGAGMMSEAANIDEMIAKLRAMTGYQFNRAKEAMGGFGSQCRSLFVVPDNPKISGNYDWSHAICDHTSALNSSLRTSYYMGGQFVLGTLSHILVLFD